jgi:hypothetical protein
VREIAVGAPRGSDGKVLGAGVVDVVYGGVHRQVLAQSGTGIAGMPEENDAFGSADFGDRSVRGDGGSVGPGVLAGCTRRRRTVPALASHAA